VVGCWGTVKGLADLIPLVEEERQRLLVAIGELRRRQE
jgi:hypothetical protein